MDTLELIGGLKAIVPFEISVAAYPETHPAALSADADLAYLKAKLDAGADRAIRQFFFDAEAFLRFRDRAATIRITKPIVPGTLPIANVKQTWKFGAMCGARVPDYTRVLFEGLDEQLPQRVLVAAVLAELMCHRLQEDGSDGFHSYKLNHVDTTVALCHLLSNRG